MNYKSGFYLNSQQETSVSCSFFSFFFLGVGDGGLMKLHSLIQACSFNVSETTWFVLLHVFC